MARQPIRKKLPALLHSVASVRLCFQFHFKPEVGTKTQSRYFFNNLRSQTREMNFVFRCAVEEKDNYERGAAGAIAPGIDFRTVFDGVPSTDDCVAGIAVADLYTTTQLPKQIRLFLPNDGLFRSVFF